MPEPQKNISTEVLRSILQHLMYGVLALLILMNWTVHRPMDYKNYEETFTKINVCNESYLQQQTDWLNNEDINSDRINPVYTKVQVVIDSSEYVIKEILKVKGLLIRMSRKEEVIQLEELLKKVNELRTTFLRAIGQDEGSPVSLNLMNNQKEVQHCLNISRGNLVLQLYTKYSIMSMLSALENNVQDDRKYVIDILLEKTRVISCGFFGNRAVCFYNNSKILIGDTVRAEISLSQNVDFSRRYSDVIVDRGKIDFSDLPVQNFAIWEDRASVLGENTINGSIRRKLDKDTITRPFSFSYFVSAPGIALHLDKANLCYVAVDNPLRISIPGYPAEKVQLKVAGAKVTKKEDGLFEIYFEKMPREKVYAYVEATNEQGRTSKVHSMELRVKELAPPITNFEEYKESGIAVDSFFARESLQLFSADAAFEMAYELISFDVEVFTHNHQYTGPLRVYGAEFSNNHELLSVMNTATPGDRLILSNIKAKAANGKLYQALPVSLLLR